jgi:protein TonB
MVVVLHAAVLVVFMLSFQLAPMQVAPPPMVAQLLQEPERNRQVEPLPPVPLEQPRIEVPSPPEVTLDVLPSEAAIAVRVQPVSKPIHETNPAPLTLPPQFEADYLSNPVPRYPPVSRRLREEGTVMLRVRVTADGEAADVRLEHTSGFPRLDTAAISAVKRWRFVPARRGKEVVEAWVLVPIEFELNA